MKFLRSGSLIVALLIVQPYRALADGLALGYATLDWTGFAITISNDLTIEDQGGSTCSQALGPGVTSGLPCKTSFYDHDLTWLYTAAEFNFSATGGYADGQAFTNNGLLATASLSAVGSLNDILYSTLSYAQMGRAFEIDGGAGLLSVMIPYSLSVSCSATGGATTEAEAFVALRSTHNVLPLAGAGDKISCRNAGGDSRSGFLAISGIVYTGLSGSGGSPFDLDLVAQTTTKAQVPEPQSALLLAAGVFFVIILAMTRSLIADRIRALATRALHLR